MALTKPTAGKGRDFLMRLAGLTGLLLATIGLALWAQVGVAGLVMAIAGAALGGLALVAEFRGAVELVGLRRGALGSNVLAQIFLGIVLLVGINWFSFFHHARLDWTRDRIFTIDADIEKQLRQLRGETTIVVYQRHSTSGPGAERDSDKDYDVAAERKIVDKVKDLVEQFQELGPRFRVELLDVQEKGFRKKMESLKSRSSALAEAIERAPENSIFFYAKLGDAEQIQRLGFHDIYQLDKKSSKESNDGRGNLVLNSQGLRPFADKVLNIQSKRPRIGVAVMHELLGMEASEERYSMPGLKKTLAAHGFDGRDIILKKWGDLGPPEPAVLTQDESKYERLEEELAEHDAEIRELERAVKRLSALIEDWKTKSVKELSKSELAKDLDVDEVTEVVRLNVLRRLLEPNLLLRKEGLDRERKERDEVYKEKMSLNVENLAETRRIADLEAKFKRLLADVDLLIVPRMTMYNAAVSQMNIPNSIHRFEETQLASIRDFMKAGKPVLFCLGPTNDPPDRRFDPTEEGADRMEAILDDLGVKMPKQTVLFNVEGKAFAERRAGIVFQGTPIEVPPVEFAWVPGGGLPQSLVSEEQENPHPIRTSLDLSVRSLGNSPSDVRLRHPRPVYFQPGKKPDNSAVILLTSANAWNEDQPFPTRERSPRFDPPKPDSPDRGTIRERRRGQFPIGVAFETQVPASWYGADKKAKPAKVRLAVLGHGGVFIATSLSPVREKLLLDTCNWLLGREDLLARKSPPWKYPRVDLSETGIALWQECAYVVLPLIFVYLGIVVLMVRRMR